jgi:metal transporter CNNM
MTYIIVIALLLLSGLFSGLTLGLLSLDKTELKRKISLGNKEAKQVYAVRKNGNLLLSTLLLGNVGVNSTLAIFLGDIASGVMAGIVATALIVVFGEIIPQSLFSRYALSFGAKTAWIVRILIIILWPICFPIAYILDKVLGDEMPTVYSKRELMKIVEEHEDSTNSDVDADEERIIIGALSFSSKTVKDIMTPRTIVYAFEKNTILDKKKLNEIKKSSFTRIPVYDEVIDNIVGILYIKDLINIEVGLPVEKVYKKSSGFVVKEDLALDELLNKFITLKNHLAFVKDKYGGLDGVVSLEDVIEEIIRQEIVDEDDKVADLQKKALVSSL